MRRPVAVALALGLTVAACGGGGAEDGRSTSTSAPDTASTAPVTADPDGREVQADDPVRPGTLSHPLADDVIYMVMIDRFSNGDPRNDFGGDEAGGGTEADILRHGFDPTRTGFYHGGDLAGLTERLDYLVDLGITAVWVTPVVANRAVQGDGTIDGSSAGYHGYWGLDFTRIDPHLGTEDEFRRFVDAAHDRDMKVILDIVVNHTADVIGYGDQSDRYRPTPTEPYRDAAGVEFDVRSVAGSPDFPDLDAAISFPLVPIVPADLADAKAPPFLNDPTNYHNRGQSTFSGENSQFGDFFGLDDLFTEKPAVVDGMIAIYLDLIDRFGIDGFRVDTAKHVDDTFWSAWLPAIRSAAGEDFAIFGEVVEPGAPALSRYVTDVPFPSVIDMRIDDAVERFAAQGAPTDDLAQVFLEDDWFTDADSNAHGLVTVISSHDFGRLGGAIDRAASEPLDETERVARMQLGLAVQFLARGTPIVYYGDEQGFAALGEDQAVREDMFPSLTAAYAAGDNIGSEVTPADDNFDPDHILFRTIADLADLRHQHSALRGGPQTMVWSVSEAGIVAWTRRAPDGTEYLVALNNATGPAAAAPATLTPNAEFTALAGGPGDGSAAGVTLTADDDGVVTIELGPLAYGVWVADRPSATVGVSDDLALVLTEGVSPFGRDLRVELQGELRAPADVVFEISAEDGRSWDLIGLDDAPPFQVFIDSDDFDGPMELRATVWIDDMLVRSVEAVWDG